MSDVTVTFTLDGEEITHSASPKRSTLDVLREDLDVRTAKPGCSPQGVCGCCAVIVSGKVRLACTLPFKSLAGKDVISLRGLPEEDREILAEAFVQSGAVQCGYCTPGIAMQTHALISEMPNPPRGAIDKALNMHICRCTGWSKIYDAVELAAAMKRGDAPVRPEGAGACGVGAALPRDEGQDLVMGERAFIDDMVRPGMLHGALVFTPKPRVKVKKIDASAALALPGVRAVVTADDFPGDRRVGLIFRDWPVMIAEGEETRCSADILAAVAADSRAIAREARDLIQVEYEELEPVLDLMEAVKDPERCLATSRVSTGDLDAALQDPDLEIIEEAFDVQPIDQAFLEPEASLVVPLRGGGVRVYSCGQGVFDDQRQLCDLFQMTPEEMQIELVTTGGAFGAKEDLNVQPHAVALALKTGRPVKLSLTMDEGVRLHPKRHAMHIRFRLAAKKDGELVGLRTLILGDTGGYASVGDKVLERAAGHAAGPYRVPNVEVEARTIYTNNPVAGAMRGFGVNQIAFALEGCLDRLAERLGLDPLELREKNALGPGDRFGTGQILDEGVGIQATLAAIRPHYEAAKAAGKHVGVACGVKNVGMGNGLAEVGRVVMEVRSAQEISVKTGFTEMGQGHNTIMRQFAAEATGLPVEIFVVECDTDRAVEAGMTTASRATYLGGNAVRDAAPKLLADLEAAGGDLGALAGRDYAGEWEAPETHLNGEGGDGHITHYAYGWATQLAIVDAAGAVEEIVAAHDVGRAINPKLCEGQIEGGVHMGIGYALSEDLPLKDGMPAERYRDLGVIKAKFTPRITPILVEHPDPRGPWGAKGVGEIGLVPTAPAIAAALRSFDGTWRNRLPMKETTAARAVGVRVRKARG